MEKRLFIFLLVLIVFLLVGCVKQPIKKEIPGSNNVKIVENEEKSVKERTEETEKQIHGFDFGIEYGPLGLAEVYSETRVHVAKPYPEAVIWKNIQSSASSAYNWVNLDAIVKEYQDAGFDKMQLLITAESPWASRDAGSLKVKDTRPKQEYEDDYVKFVKAAVERYDKDGIDDMPGLKYPINEWGVEREFSGFFPGNGNEYVEVLKLAYPAIKEANPNAKVMLNALFMSSMFVGNPDEKEVERRLKEEKILGNPKTVNDIRIILDAVDYYDTVDLHLLSDYSEIPATVRWIKGELKKRDVSKEIYGGDVFPMSPLFIGFETCNIGPLSGKEIYPVDSKTRCEAVEIIGAVRKKNDPNHKKANEWLERNIAVNIPRKFAVSAYEGLKGINIGNMEDWFIPFGAGVSPNMGLIDTASMLDKIRQPKEKRPGFYAVKMSIKYLEGFDSVRKIDLIGNAYVYEFTKSGEKIIVAWYDDGKFYGLDKETPSIEISVPWNKKSAKITEVPVKRGNEEGSLQIIDSANGRLNFKLGYTTVFIM
ncbi:hypothetical protein J4409_00750 [Candidatus Woesearchaeota archaeon]|nr:hypothetical protein [Candidatus Woesearchaeota archaeon]